MRQDSVLDLIARAETAHQKAAKRVKVTQRWSGCVGVWIDPNEVEQLVDALTSLKNRRWQIDPERIHHGSNWVSFYASYTAKGANANDAENLVRRYVRIEDDEKIAIDSVTVVPA